MNVDLTDRRFVSADADPSLEDYLAEGDLILTRLSGSLEFVGVGAVVRNLGDELLLFPDRIFRCRLLDPELADYLEIYLAAPQFRRQVESVVRSAAGHQRISIRDVKSFSVALPPPADRAAIVTRVRAWLDVIAQAEARIRAAKQKLEATEQSMLARGFSRADKGSEPASEQTRNSKLSPVELSIRIRQPSSAGRDVQGEDTSLRTPELVTDLERIIAALATSSEPLSPEELFSAAGFNPRTSLESADRFYEAVRAAQTDGHVQELRGPRGSSTIRLTLVAD